MASQVVSKSYFCIPEPGKPDPYQPWNSNAQEPRKRVIDHGQKGATCGFAALQLLRNNHRIGKVPPDSMREQREMEKTLSAHRKQITKIDHDLSWRISFACQITQTLGGSCTREKAQEIIDKPSSIEKKHQKVCCEALKEFCAQTDFDEFVLFAKEAYTQALMKAERKLLKHTFNVSNAEIVSSVSDNLQKAWKDLTTMERHTHVRDLGFQRSYQVYGCQKSLWHPEQPLEALMLQLKKYGPLLMNGYFGQCYYKEDPFRLRDKIEGRNVFGWKPNAARKEVIDAHCILVVGVNVERKLIYYLDPLDGSDPKDITTQKVYVMSEDRFKSELANLSGFRWKDSSNEMKPVFEDMINGPNPYALYL